MGNEEKPSPESKESKETTKGPDWFLQLLVQITNGIEAHLPLTLNVGGLLISGELVSGHVYFNGFADELKNAMKGVSESAAGAVDDFRKLGEIYKLELSEPEKEIKRPSPLFIHLRNTRMFHPGGQPIPSNRGVWWRGRLESVDGFILGSLSVD